VLPNFFVIGAAKAGTSSLHHYLATHPSVFMSAKKELDFFNMGGAGRRRGTRWYEQQFEGARDAIAIGESSAQYAMFPSIPGVPAEIARVIPHAKLVYIVRHPIKRLLSFYLHRFDGPESRPLERAVREDALYVDSSRYAFQIEQYLEYFPPEQIFVVVSEHLREDAGAAIESVYCFLGVDGSWRSAAFAREHNVTIGKRMPKGPTKMIMNLPGWPSVAQVLPRSVKKGARRITHGPTPEIHLSPELEAELEEIFRPDVERLRRYVRGQFDGWGIG
jgi:hypothetical protein